MDVHIPKFWVLWISTLAAVVIFIAFLLFYFWYHRRKQMFSPFTEDSLRLPGHSVRIMYSQTGDNLLLLYFLFTFVFVGIPFFWIVLDGLLRYVFTAAALACGVFILYKVWKQIGMLRSYGLGREGEEYTGQELNLLMRAGAFVFHDIPYKYGNIDHIVIGNNKIFVVETKAIRKPWSKDSNSKEAKVFFDGKVLKFPNFTTAKPVDQAMLHAEFLSDILRKKCESEIPVIAVVALPGWYIENENKFENVLVINPKRGKALRNWIGKPEDKKARDKVVAYVASVARSVDQASDKTDPDASRKYDFWLNPRVKEAAIGD